MNSKISGWSFPVLRGVFVALALVAGAVAGADNPIADMYCSIRIVGPAVATRTDVLISDLYFVPTNTSNP